MIGLRSIVLPLVGCACAGVALAQGACVVAPPPGLAPLIQRPPRILHDSVVPPAGLPLTTWPSAFLVPVVVDDPSGQYDYRVFVDYPQWADPLSPQPSPPPVVDGGAILSIAINPQESNRLIDLGACHQVKVVVARSFLQNNVTPDSLGGDTVFWPYYPTGDPFTCIVADAGTGSSIGDATADVLPVPPPSEGGDL
jgi:hypothetical protein